ncbi:PilN domain-containing protein [Candidatus Magnetominusculus xianensis]|uniref:Fimbrial assembly protein n=1 Tax=Candidatus Magnetominusculus xianensis TaxID=1748249 RepID=A0ABR5SFI5_9BACT|nr:PilN domain-containing protein [Candidatus Magnetominusculus xianensis]KWT85934.1 fimbrial assembly protein [Candidatus Magnetominusculus xianensis]MBF0403607.1 PilN domain-containing protein [Nitrospirota bacterium]
MTALDSYARNALRSLSLSGSTFTGFLSAAKRLLFYSPLARLFHTQKYLSIVLDKDAASACVIKMSSSGFKVLNRNTFSDTYPGPEELVSFLSLVVEGKSASALKTILNVPKEWCVIKTAEFPAIAIDNISSAVAFQIPDLTPFSTADVYYDFEIIKREADKLYTVISAVKRQMAEPYLRALESSGFKVSSLVLSPVSLASLLGQVPALTSNIVLVNLKKTHVELVRADRGITTAVYVVKGDTGDIVKAVEGIRGEDTSVIINGPDADAVSRLKAALACKDISELLPALNNTVGYEYLTAAAAVFADAKGKTKAMNMLSMGETQKKSLPIALTICLSIIVIVLFTLSLYIPVWKDEKTVASIDKQVKALKPEYERLTALQKDTKKIDGDLTALNSMMAKRVLMLELLRELTETLPHDTWLARLIATDKDINIEGYAVNASALIGTIENSKYFKDAGTASTTFKDARMGKERFQIKAALK